MATAETNDIRVLNAKNLVRALTGDSSYTFIGRVSPWDNDNDPPTPDNSIREYYDMYDELLSLKRISANDVVHMIPRTTWISGIIYDIYRHDYNSSNRAFSGANNLKDCRHIVVNGMGQVYVCLDNDNNTQSLVEPQATSYLPFFTSDGYQWQLLYTISANRMREYSTTNFIPVYDAEQTRPAGEISTVKIENRGTGYTNSPKGYNNQIDYYYCSIDGDGSDAVARLEIISGGVGKVDVIRGGFGYSYATINFVKDNCYGSLSDYDQNINKLDPGGLETFRSTVIIPPRGGWGTDNVLHTYASRVGVFSTLKYDMTDTVQDVVFRQCGILTNPESDGDETLSAYYSVQVSFQKGDGFSVGSLIEQSRPDGVAKGEVVGWDAENNILSYIQNPKIHADTDGNLVRFVGDFVITGTGQATPTTFTGTIDGLDFVGGYKVPELVRDTGTLTYLTNIRPVKRNALQSEALSFVISF